MNFSNLKYFLVVSEEMNITKAANRLHISQQALSNHITKLEGEIGTQLFERNPGLSLTYAGEQLVETSNQILDLHNQYLSRVRDISGIITSELTIGITHTRGQALLPMLLPAFHKAHPEVNIHIEEANAKALEESLSHGFVDLILGFVPFLTDCAEVTEISADRLFLAVPVNIMEQMYEDPEEREQKRLEFREGVDISAFAQQPFILLKKGDRIRTILDSYFKSHHMIPRILMETSNIQTAFALAKEGMGIAVYPEMFLRGTTTLSADRGGSHAMEYYPLKGSANEILAIAYNKERYLPQAAKDFISTTHEIFGEFSKETAKTSDSGIFLKK